MLHTVALKPARGIPLPAFTEEGSLHFLQLHPLTPNGIGAVLSRPSPFLVRSSPVFGDGEAGSGFAAAAAASAAAAARQVGGDGCAQWLSALNCTTPAQVPPHPVLLQTSPINLARSCPRHRQILLQLRLWRCRSECRPGAGACPPREHGGGTGAPGGSHPQGAAAWLGGAGEGCLRRAWRSEQRIVLLGVMLLWV